MACIVLAVLACDPELQVPDFCRRNLGAIQVRAAEGKTAIARAVSCMSATARKAAQNVALDPVMIASLVQTVVPNCNASACFSDPCSWRETLPVCMVAKIFQCDAKLVEMLRADISEYGFKGPYSLVIFGFNGWWLDGQARNVSHKHWKRMFCASPESFKLIREYMAEVLQWRESGGGSGVGSYQRIWKVSGRSVEGSGIRAREPWTLRGRTCLIVTAAAAERHRQEMENLKRKSSLEVQELKDEVAEMQAQSSASDAAAEQQQQELKALKAEAAQVQQLEDKLAAVEAQHASATAAAAEQHQKEMENLK
eukprot:s29_g71.t1